MVLVWLAVWICGGGCVLAGSSRAGNESRKAEKWEKSPACTDAPFFLLPRQSAAASQTMDPHVLHISTSVKSSLCTESQQRRHAANAIHLIRPDFAISLDTGNTNQLSVLCACRSLGIVAIGSLRERSTARAGPLIYSCGKDSLIGGVCGQRMP